MRWIAGLTIAAVALNSGEAIAAVDRCSEGEVVARYLKARCEGDASFELPKRVLTFSHPARRWQGEHVVRVEVTTAAPRECRVTMMEQPAPRERRDGTAWTYRGRRERVLALVTGTNPMLYSAVPKGGEPRDIEELAGLQSVAALAGGALTATASALAVRTLAARTLKESEPAASALTPFTFDPYSGLWSKSTSPTPSPEATPKIDWKTLATELSDHAEERIAAVDTALSDVSKKLTTLDESLQQLGVEDDRVIPYLQALEDGRRPEWLNPPPPHLTAPDIDDRFGDVRKALRALGAKPFKCLEPYVAVRDATAALLAKDPTPGSLTEAATAAEELQNVKSSDCTRPEKATFSAIGRALEKPSRADPDTRQGLDMLHASASVYLAAHEARTALQEKTDKLLDERTAAVSTAASLDALRRREVDRAVSVAMEGCPRSGILEVPTRKDIYEWNTVQPFPFEVTADAPGADKVSERLIDPGAAAYELEPSAWFRPLVSFGVTRARSLREPTFGLVEIDEKQYVERVSEERRLAVPVAFVSFRLFPGHTPRAVGRLDPAVDLGVGVDPSDPALFVGGSLRVFFGARLGVGATWQQITALDGQREVVVLSNGSIDPASLVSEAEVRAVRTRSTFPRSLYFSLSFPLATLPFFGK